jgi:hypothetical protein
MRSTLFLTLGALVLGCSPGSSQVKGKPDLSVSDARKIPPLPPQKVSIKVKRKQTIVTWDLVPLDNIVAYKVYRKLGDSPYTQVATIERPPFVDKNPASGSASYAVTAVNTYQAESALSTPAKK